MKKLLIRGALVMDPSTRLEKLADVLIADGVICMVGVDLQASQAIDDVTVLQAIDDAEVLPADGLVCAPGLVDMHVHLRDPGQTYKEDVLSGCAAASAGGVTSVACMPNTSPVCDQPSVIDGILQKAAAASARVYPVAAVSASLGGETLTDFAALKQSGAIAVSDDGRPVPTADLMRRAMEQAAACGMPILSHCEDLSLVRGGIMNEGETSRLLGVKGIHRSAEEVATAREIALAAATGCPVHICHVSTKGSVALIRDARRRGIPVTGETAPHYFLLTDTLLRGMDADYRMNPPLRTQEDVEAVIEGICDGTLTVIATDHAPHSPEDKQPFLTAPNGSVGLETSLAAGITALVQPGHISLSRLVALMSTIPAQILGIPAGTLKIGAAADLVLFDPAEQWTVDPAKLHGKSRNTPFKGMTLTGKVKVTILGGKVVYQDTV